MKPSVAADFGTGRHGNEPPGRGPLVAPVLANEPGGVVTIDASGLVLTFDATAERQLGFAAAEVVGKSVTTLMDESLLSANDECHLECRLGAREARLLGRQAVVAIRSKTGAALKMNVRLAQDPGADGAPRFAGIVRGDSGTEAGTETIVEELGRSHSTLSMLVENAEDCMWAVDRSLRLTTFNSACRSFFSTANRPLVVGLSLADLVPTSELPFLQGIHERGLLGERLRVEILRPAASAKRTYDISLNPILDVGGGIGGVSVVARDRTLERAAEEAVKEASETRRRLIQRLLEAQEDERHSISRELRE